MASVESSLREIFADAAEIADPAERAKFLDGACQGDLALRARVERLLAADATAGNFLKSTGDTTTTGGLVSEKPGDRIGRYRLIERIGRGGGGVVYLDEQEEPVRRRVALKILKLGMDTQSVVTRFEAERQALAMMDHPSIAKVLDGGATETGRPYFVMELVTGQKLSEYCDRRQLSLAQRLQLFISVCHAVQHAHQKGIVHRDLKPSNILVTEHEGVAVPKVIDFGIAKAVEEGLDPQSGLTSVNQFLGTPAYMSPEQVDFGGRDIDTRSDIYSLGVILYELLAGQPPFDPKELARAGLDEMRRIIREVDPPRPSTTITKNLNPSRLPTRPQPARDRLAAIRGDLDWVVMKCLEKDRSRRYATANGLAMDLRRHLDNEPVLARPPSRLYRLKKILQRHQLLFGAAAAILLVSIAGLIVSTYEAWRARQAEREQARLRDVAEAKADESRLRLIRRYVAEGNRLLEENRPVAALPWMVEALELELKDPQREADERLRIAQGLLGAPQLRLHLAQDRDVNCVALSPDGSRLAAGSEDGAISMSDVDNGCVVLTNLALPLTVGRVQFSPDGTKLLAMDRGGHARVWDAASGEPLSPVLLADDFKPQSVGDVERRLNPAASFSLDGKFLLLAWGSKSAQLRDAATGNLVRQFTHTDVVYHAVFSPDGRLVVTSSKDRTARVWDVATGKPAGPALEHAGMVAWSQFSSDGNRLLTVRECHNVQLWDWREARRIAPEIPRRSVLYHASLSPDGTNILTTAWSGYAHMYDAASSRLMYQFQQHGGLVDAGFSPDGQHVATACEDGNAWVWDLAQANSPPMQLPQGNHIEEIAFSTDGRRLAVGSRGGHARVWDLFPPEHGVRRLPGHDVEWVDFDQSGQRALVLSTRQPSNLGVYEVSKAKLISTANLRPGQARYARFSPDGHRVLAGNSSALLVLDADTGRPLFPPLQPAGRIYDARWSPDGKLVLAAASSAGAVAWDAVTGKVARTYRGTNAVTALALSRDGLRLATAQDDRTVQLWETLTGKRINSSISTPGPVHQLEFSPDGKRLALATGNATEGLVEVFDIASGMIVGRPLVHRETVNEFAFSSDGRWLATACDDHSARVWDGDTGQPVSPWLPQGFETRNVSFSPDSTRLVTLTRRGEARLWSAATGEPITVPILYPRNTGTGHVVFSPDGLGLLLCRGGNEAWLRDLRPETAKVEELRLLAQVLSCTRFDPAAGMVPLDEAGLNRAWDQLRALHLGAN